MTKTIKDILQQHDNDIKQLRLKAEQVKQDIMKDIKNKLKRIDINDYIE